MDITRADDFEVGQFLTILNGVRQPCGCGQACGPEAYEHLRGLPLAVTGVALPYLATTVLHFGKLQVIDTRLCRLIKVSDSYVAAFQGGTQPQVDQPMAAHPEFPDPDSIVEFDGDGEDDDPPMPVCNEP
jgi:hypothetical protein